jgi:hypothetical protein
MKEFTDQKLIRQYLLGDLDESKRQQFEDHIFTDREYFERALMIEDELVEDFVFDLLPPIDRAKFVEHFLSTPTQIQKLNVTRALQKYSRLAAARIPSRKDRLINFFRGRNLVVGVSLAAILLIASLVGVWMSTRNSLQKELARLNNTGATGIQGDSGLGTSDYQINLIPIRVRSGNQTNLGSQQRILVPAGVQVVQLRLQLATDGNRDFQAELKKEPDSSLFTLRSVKATADGKLLIVRVPAKVLSPGEYQLILSGVFPDGQLQYVGSYVFRVVDENNQ